MLYASENAFYLSLLLLIWRFNWKLWLKKTSYGTANHAEFNLFLPFLFLALALLDEFY